MHAPAEPAIGRGDHALAPDQVGKPHDAFGDQFRVLDDIGRVADDAGQDELAVRQLHVLPYAPLVLMAHIARLE